MMLKREPPKELTEEEIKARKLRKMNKEFFKLLEKSDKQSEHNFADSRPLDDRKLTDKGKSGTLSNLNGPLRSQTDDQAAKIREKNRREEEELRAANLERLKQENEMKRRMLMKTDEEFLAVMQRKTNQGSSNSKERSTRESNTPVTSQKPKPKPKEGQPPEHFNFSLITSNNSIQKGAQNLGQVKDLHRASPSSYNPLESQLSSREYAAAPRPSALKNAGPVQRPTNAANNPKPASGYNPLDSQLKAPSQGNKREQYEAVRRSEGPEIAAVTNPPKHMIHDLALIKRKMDMKRREEAQKFGLPPPAEDKAPAANRGESSHKQTHSGTKEPKRKKADLERDPDYQYCFRCQEHHHKSKHQLGMGLSTLLAPPSRPLVSAAPLRPKVGVVPTSDPRAQHRQEMEQKRQLEAALGKRYVEKDPPHRPKPNPAAREQHSRDYRSNHDYQREPRQPDRHQTSHRGDSEYRREPKVPESSYDELEEEEPDDDSDLSGFIDNDAPVEYDSRRIKKEIYSALRYDAERYRKNDTAIDDRDMEVRTYAAIEREEKYSRRIGQLEDRLEEERNLRLARKPAPVSDHRR